MLPAYTTGMYSWAIRSAIWADGSHEITRDPGGNSIIACTCRAVNTTAWWVICTPLGCPVVPDV